MHHSPAAKHETNRITLLLQILRFELTPLGNEKILVRLALRKSSQIALHDLENLMGIMP